MFINYDILKRSLAQWLIKCLPMILLPFTGYILYAQEPDTSPDVANQPALSDPTRPSARIKDVLKAELSNLQGISLKGLIVASGKDGIALLDLRDSGQMLVRSNTILSVTIGGVPLKIAVKKVGPDGVEIEAPTLKESIVVSGYGQGPDGTSSPTSTIRYVELRNVILEDALRMLSDQSGTNYSASAEAAKVSVSVFLRNVPSHVVIEEVCKNNNLWFRQDEKSGVCRIMTMKEFERDLVSFHEEKDEVFTLLYPNVLEVATTIQNLYGDRARLSFGRDDGDDESRELASRFQRFDLVNQRSQGLGALRGTGGQSQENYGGYGNYGNYGGIGTTVIAGNSGALWSSGRENAAPYVWTSPNNNSNTGNNNFKNLTPDQAQQVQRVLASSTSSNDAQQALQAFREKPSTIFVTVSKRNNMIIVRTSDSRALEDIRTLVRRLDVPTSMVLLEVKILSLELGDGFNSIFDYQLNGTLKTGGGVGLATAGFNQGDIQPPSTVGSMVPGGTGLGTGLGSGDMTFQIVNEYFKARMQVLETKKRVTTLATPLLLTANNEVSRLFLGEERPLVRNVSGQTILTEYSTAVTPSTSIEFRPVGMTLLITANINSDRTVTLRLLQEDSTISSGGATIPIIGSTGVVQNVSVDVVSSRSISGTFVAKDNMAVAVGGLISEKIVDHREQVPILGKIPIIGILFRRDVKSKTRQELVILIKPHVMSTPSEGEGISRTLMKDLSVHPVLPDIKASLDTFKETMPAKNKSDSK